MSWGLLYGYRIVVAPKCQKTTEIGTETVDTETASGIMALSQTTGHGTYFSSHCEKETEEEKKA
jgi:hypothetical protein